MAINYTLLASNFFKYNSLITIITMYCHHIVVKKNYTFRFRINLIFIIKTYLRESLELFKNKLYNCSHPFIIFFFFFAVFSSSFFYNLVFRVINFSFLFLFCCASFNSYSPSVLIFCCVCVLFPPPPPSLLE